MTAEEFNEAFALSQFLPGPNVVNFSVVFGSRFGGAAGAAVALAGLMGPPLIIVTVLAVLYARFGDLEVLGRILAGITAAAVGLLIAVVAKMAAPMFRKRWDWAPLDCNRRLHRRRHHAMAAAVGVRSACAGQHRVRMGKTMNDNPLIALARLFRAAVVVCGRRRQRGDSGNASHCG